MASITAELFDAWMRPRPAARGSPGALRFAPRQGSGQLEEAVDHGIDLIWHLELVKVARTDGDSNRQVRLDLQQPKILRVELSAEKQCWDVTACHRFGAVPRGELLDDRRCDREWDCGHHVGDQESQRRVAGAHVLDIAASYLLAVWAGQLLREGIEPPAHLRVPADRAWIDEDERSRQRRAATCQLDGDHPAKAVADDDRPLDAHRLAEL